MKEKKVFLGGTCNGSKWRDKIIPLLKINYFNPVVSDWTPECQEEEERQKKICKYQLYVITPKMKGFFSIAEVVESSNKNPKGTILCVLDKDGEEEFEEFQKRSLDAVMKLVHRNNSFVSKNISEVVDYLNGELLSSTCSNSDICGYFPCKIKKNEVCPLYKKDDTQPVAE